MIDQIRIAHSENSNGKRFEQIRVWIAGIPFQADASEQTTRVMKRVAHELGIEFLDHRITRDGEFNGNAPVDEIRPFSTYPEDRERLLSLATTLQKPHDVETREKAADGLSDLVIAILTDEQAVLDAELFDQMTEEFSQEVEQGWQTFKAATPAAVVINDNQPGKTAIIEILNDPPTLAVGTKLFAAPVKA
ncbi:hypothetical protein [Agrobacterium sp. M50-1]|uniref:hypothetical protein n=1 Tax=Agrobacterium sp. M50-1 TaxID=3132821 RepID=UPI003CE4ABE0